ncbi:MAG: tripartite tricarboxylate transporter TctB family protein [Clostridiaceae bacterium]|nr:tripartite tricarboxylate transporter TctB family protein [Clostridiaceae bacterium]
MKDRTMGIISVLVSLFLLFSLRGKAFEAKAFPVALLIVLAILSILLIFDKKKKTYEFKSLYKVLLYYLLFFVYVAVMPYIGFIISTTCFMCLFIIMSKYDINKVMAAVLSLLTALITWFIFSHLFGISLPEILF